MPTGVYFRTVEYRQKQREAMLRRINPGKNKSDATKRKISEAQRGKTKSDSFKEKCRQRMIGVAFFRGRKHRPESIALIKERNSGQNHYNWRGGIAFNKNQYSVSLRRKKNGFSTELFNLLMEKQKGLCAICEIKLSTGLIPTSACADHCHATNEPRGILCKKCNLLLGHAKDDIRILKKAISYLSFWKGIS